MAATARPVDLTDVKDGGNFRPRRKPEGDYRAKIVKVDDHTPKSAGSVPGWVLTIQVEGDGRSTYPYYLNPAKNQVWKIGAICRAAGLNVKNARIRFDPNKLVNKAIGIALMDEEYNDRLKSVIDDVFPVSEVGGNADEDDIDTDEEIVEDEPVEEDEPEEEEEPAPKPTRRRKPAPEPEPEDDDEEDEDEEEPEPTPPPRKRAARKPAPKPAPVEDDDDDLDLDDLDD
jgi:hypothetical protein